MAHIKSNAGLSSYLNHTTYWRLAGATYYITWSLASGQPELTFDERSMVAAAIEYFSNARYRLYAYVVMHDHVHIIFTPLAGFDPGKIVHSWKSYSAHQLQRQFWRIGQLWLKDYYDRIVRDEADLKQKMQYVLDNPRRRWPELSDYPFMRWFPL